MVGKPATAHVSWITVLVTRGVVVSLREGQTETRLPYPSGWGLVGYTSILSTVNHVNIAHQTNGKS